MSARGLISHRLVPIQLAGAGEAPEDAVVEEKSNSPSRPVTSLTERPAAVTEASIDTKLDDYQREVVELFVAGAKVIGLPRSVGEIYGLLYMEPKPLCLDELQQRLGLSRGSVSQGLRQLREVGAIRLTYVPGQRKDHFSAETELRRLLGGFLARQVRPHLDSGSERLKRLRGCDSTALEPQRLEHYQGRIQKLAQWHGRTSKLLPILQRFAG